MAWGNKDINYKEEFGVESKEELLARLQEVNNLKTQNETLQTKLTTQEAEVNTVKATLASIEERVKTIQPVQQQQQQTRENVEIPSVQDDENAAFAARMAPIYAQNLNTTAMVVEDQVFRRISTTDPRFGKFEKEARDLLHSAHISARANMGVNPTTKKTYAEELVENCYLIVKGRHTDNIVQDTVAGKGEFFVESGRNSGNSGNSEVKTDPTILTDDDRKIIAKMGVSEKVYQQILKDGGPNMGGALAGKTSF